jgi:branched-chain amino acid transport system permease protein
MEFAKAIVDGVLLGLIYGAVAAGFNVLFRASKIPNLAQGQLVMLGAYFIWWLSSFGLSPVYSFLAGIALTALTAAIVGVVLFRPLMGRPVLTIAAAAIALVGILHSLVLIAWGSTERAFPAIFDFAIFDFGGLRVDGTLAVGGLVCLAAVIAVAFYIEFSRRGQQVTAVAEDHVVAASLGVSLTNSMITGWLLSGGLAAVSAGALFSGHLLNPNIDQVGLRALPASLAAGLESIAFVPVTGIFIGISEVIAQRYLDARSSGMASLAMPYVVLLLIVIIRPQGIYGWKINDRV